MRIINKKTVTKWRQYPLWIRLARVNARFIPRALAKFFDVASHNITKVIPIVISFAFTNLIYMPSVALALFVVYMGHYHFFSYDFFIDGIFGMKLFTMTLFAIMVALSMMTFGALFMLTANRFKKGAFSKKWICCAGVVNLLIIAVLFLPTGLVANKRLFLSFTIGISVCLAVHFGTLLFAKGVKKKLEMLAIFSAATFGLIACAPDMTVQLLEMGLRGFGVGGKIPVEIAMDSETVNAKLILLSPKTVYYLKGDDVKVTTQDYSKVTSIRQLSPP